MGLVRPLSFHPISHGRLRERRKTLTSHPTPLRWTRSGSLALLVTRAMVISGDRTPRASGQTDRGLGSQQRSLVRRGQRSTMAVRRDAPSWLVGDNPSGAEASSGSPDTCRSTGCGVEKATEIPRSERRAIGVVVQIHTKFCSASGGTVRLARSTKFRSKNSSFRSFHSHQSSARSLSLRLRSRSVPGNRLPFPPRVARLSLSLEPSSRPLTV